MRPVPTRSSLGILLRAAFGGLLGLGAAILLRLRDQGIHSADELQRLGFDPVLGMIPFDRRARVAPLVFEAGAQSSRAEAFRHLRTNLAFLDVDAPLHVLVVTSSVAEEGKSFISANVALTMAAANRRVLLIEADLRRPMVADYFGVTRSRGLADVIAGRATVADVLQPWGNGALFIMPAGSLPPNPSELLGSESMRTLIHELKGRFDVILIDTPPLLPVTDGAVMAALADGVVLVVREGSTTRGQLDLSAQRIEAVGAKFLGSILNMVATSTNSEYTSYKRRPDDQAATATEPERPERSGSSPRPPGPGPRPEPAASGPRAERAGPSPERAGPSTEPDRPSGQPKPDGANRNRSNRNRNRNRSRAGKPPRPTDGSAPQQSSGSPPPATPREPGQAPEPERRDDAPTSVGPHLPTTRADADDQERS